MRLVTIKITEAAKRSGYEKVISVGPSNVLYIQNRNGIFYVLLDDKYRSKIHSSFEGKPHSTCLLACGHALDFIGLLMRRGFIGT